MKYQVDVYSRVPKASTLPRAAAKRSRGAAHFILVSAIYEFYEMQQENTSVVVFIRGGPMTQEP